MKLKFMQSQCDKCGAIGYIGEAFEMKVKHGYAPYFGATFEGFSLTCKVCRHKQL